VGWGTALQGAKRGKQRRKSLSAKKEQGHAGTVSFQWVPLGSNGVGQMGFNMNIMGPVLTAFHSSEVKAWEGPLGTFGYNFGPFGLCRAPFVCQRLRSSIGAASGGSKSSKMIPTGLI
jgi:hypothetical protein